MKSHPCTYLHDRTFALKKKNETHISKWNDIVGCETEPENGKSKCTTQSSYHAIDKICMIWIQTNSNSMVKPFNDFRCFSFCFYFFLVGIQFGNYSSNKKPCIAFSKTRKVFHWLNLTVQCLLFLSSSCYLHSI